MEEDIKKVCKLCVESDLFEGKQPQPKTIASAVIFFFFQLPWRYPNFPKVERSLNEIREVSMIKHEATIKKNMQTLYEKKEWILKKISEEPSISNGGRV